MKKYNGTAWVDTTLRQYKTATAEIEPTIYTDGTAITSYTIKGNTFQNGTPTPSNPVDVQGVGTLDSGQYKIPISNGQQTTNIYLGSTQTTRQVKKLVLDGTEDWTRQSLNNYGIANFQLSMPDRLMGTDTIGFVTHFEQQTTAISVTQSMGYYIGGGASKALYLRCDSTIGTDKTDFTAWLAEQYANGTPVTVYYVLATPETAAVNEPLQKIGNYADTLSNAASIPTTEGANSITVDTTVQPSEFTATWTGWHNASVKEWDGSDWS